MLVESNLYQHFLFAGVAKNIEKQKWGDENWNTIDLKS